MTSCAGQTQRPPGQWVHASGQRAVLIRLHSTRWRAEVRDARGITLRTHTTRSRREVQAWLTGRGFCEVVS